MTFWFDRFYYPDHSIQLFGYTSCTLKKNEAE